MLFSLLSILFYFCLITFVNFFYKLCLCKTVIILVMEIKLVAVGCLKNKCENCSSLNFGRFIVKFCFDN